MALLDPDTGDAFPDIASPALPGADGASLRLVPVDYDPFSGDAAATSAPKLIPVDHDPFAAPAVPADPYSAAIAAGDPEAAVGAAIAPAVTNYIRDIPNQLVKHFGPDPNAPNPRTDFAAAALDPSGMSQAANVALGSGPGAIKTPAGSLFDYSRLADVPDVPQFDLPRVTPARGVPARTVAAMTDPGNIARVEDAVRQGVELGGPGWYNTQQLGDYFTDILGSDAGPVAYRRYMDYVGATSPRSKVPENIRNASYYYTLEQQGIPPPQIIKGSSGGMGSLSEALPSPYGHMAQRLHVQNVNNLLDTGSLPVLQNPKPPSFTENLMGNQLPLTADVHNVRLWGLTDSMGRPVDVPAPNEYGYVESQEQEMARRLGMTTAQFQASAWLGGGAQTGMKSGFEPFLQHFENRVNLTAQKRGETPIETLRKMITGEAPLLSFGAAAVPGAGLAAALAAQPAGVDQPPSN